MSDTFKFPGGYDVKICRKEDIINCIDENIIDKDIALALINRCETDAENFIQSGRWTGIPFMGSFRVPKANQEYMSEEQINLRKEAKEVLDKQKYVLFKQQLFIENKSKAKINRYYKYIASISIRRNKSVYKKLCKYKGEIYTRLYLYTIYEMTAIDNNYIQIDNDK